MNLRWLIYVFLGLGSLHAGASLEADLKELDVHDAIPSLQLKERLSAVQMRANPLKGKGEALLGGGQVFSGSGFLITRQIDLQGVYHFDDRWAMAGGLAIVNNTFTGSAQNLLHTAGYLPDVDYARHRVEARAQYNLFYGKIRFSSQQAISFDQYIGLGAAYHGLRSGMSVGPMADLGFAFYVLNGQGTFHFGLRDYYYSENRTLTQGATHSVQGYVQAGILL